MRVSLEILEENSSSEI